MLGSRLLDMRKAKERELWHDKALTSELAKESTRVLERQVNRPNCLSHRRRNIRKDLQGMRIQIKTKYESRKQWKTRGTSAPSIYPLFSLLHRSKFFLLPSQYDAKLKEMEESLLRKWGHVQLERDKLVKKHELMEWQVKTVRGRARGMQDRERNFILFTHLSAVTRCQMKLWINRGTYLMFTIPV